MKTADSQTHSQQHQADQSTSSAQGLESAFFSERSPNPTPFFPSGTTLGVQAKPLHNIQPFFQPGRTPALQLKCAGCEAEQDDSPTVQRMPAFESDAEAPMVQPKRLIQRQAESPEPEAEEATAEESELSDKMASQGGAADDAGDSHQPAFSFAQMKLTIGRPNDPFEQEADAVADQVVSQPKQQEHLAAGIQTKPLEKVISRLPSHPTIAIPYKRSPKRIQKQEGQPATASDDVANRLSSSQGWGSSLDDNTRGEMESSFGADFSQVRVHTGGEATQLSQDLGAKAFTHGPDIYFNQGQYSPNSSDGKHLLAHELTHTVQQGAAVQRKPEGVSQSHIPDVQAGFFDDVGGAIGSAAGSVASVAGSVANAGAGLVGLSIEDLREMLAEFADDKLPVYSLLSVAIEYDVLRGKRVERTRENIIKGVFSLINPLGSILRKRLEERGIIDQVFEWIDSELTRLGLTIGDIKAKLSQFLDGVILATTSPIDDNIDLFKRTFGAIFSSIGTFIKNVGNKVYAMIKQAFLKLLGELAKQIGGYDLLADLLGEDPITGEARNAGIADILRGILKLPVIQAIGGDKLLKKLEELKLIDKTAEWIDGQWALLKKGFNSLLSIADKFLSLFTLSLEVLTNPLKIVNEIKTEVVGFVSTVISFFRNLASKALEIVKEAMIWLVNKFVDKNSPAWDLAVFVLGQNPLTGEKVPRNYLKLIGAFLKLLPGGDALYQKFIETGALQRMVGWIQNAIQKFIAILLGMKDAFVNMWQVVTINALLNPIGFFTEVVNLFKKPVLRLVAFVKNVLVKLFEVLMGLMKLPVEVAKAIIANVVKAFNDIRKDPIKFLLNLLRAVKQGFVQFFDNIGKHLLAGVTGWIFGQLAKTGITIPQKLDVASILDLVMQVLNLTIDNLWARLAKRIGQDKVDKIKGSIDKLVGIWTFVTDVVKNGIAAIWKYIQTKISGLWDMILEKAKNWIVITIIEKVTTKLLTMLDPTGIMAVINGFIAFYKAIESFIEKINEMLQIAASFVKGVAAIARGTVFKAADYLEFSLASSLPVALSFLANQVELGGIGDKIREIIQTVRGFIDKGIDWLVDKAVKGLQWILAKIGFGKRESKGESTEGAKGKDHWLNEKADFKEDGKQHHVTFNGVNIKVASENPETLESLYEKRKNTKPDLTDEQKNKIEATFPIRNDLVALVDKHGKDQAVATSDNMLADISSNVDRMLGEIADLLKDGNLFADQTPLPPTKVTFKMEGGKSTNITANPLTKVPGNTQGNGSSSGLAPVGERLKQAANNLPSSTGKDTKARNWKHVHLLSHLLHGPYSLNNIVIGNTALNSALAVFEHGTHRGEGADSGAYKGKSLRDNYIYHYEVNVRYFAPEDIVDEADAVVGNKSHYPDKVFLTIKRKASKDEENWETVASGKTVDPQLDLSEFRDVDMTNTKVIDTHGAIPSGSPAAMIESELSRLQEQATVRISEWKVAGENYNWSRFSNRSDVTKLKGLGIDAWKQLKLHYLKEKGKIDSP